TALSVTPCTHSAWCSVSSFQVANGSGPGNRRSPHTSTWWYSRSRQASNTRRNLSACPWISLRQRKRMTRRYLTLVATAGPKQRQGALCGAETVRALETEVCALGGGQRARP